MTLLDRPEPLIARALVSWYRASRRDLPWRRRASDAYAVWVSEIMLQQTTVAAVIPFYERWMQRFPTVESLAAAPVGDVLRLWAGLGYYARARNLHAAAQEVVARFAGRVPDTVAQLLTLPGVGEYTAGAIASIAYGVPVPLVDVNVARVVSRLYALTADPRGTAGRRELWKRAQGLIPPGDAGDFNQALMELGATICSPAAPACDVCPVRAHCGAYAAGDPASFPTAPAPKRWKAVDDVAVVVEAGATILLVRRDLSEKLWGGLWELPRVTCRDGERPPDAARRALQDRGISSVDAPRTFGAIKHVVANRKITLHGYACAANGSPEPACGEYAWVSPSAAADYPMATPQTRILAAWRRERLQTALELGE